MYCGSCMRDNALARALIRRGHDVSLVPLYTPTRTDEENVSEDRVFFGGISIYLQQKSALFRWLPRWVDRLWDSRWALRAATSGSLQTSPDHLGALTVTMLEGRHGVLRKEFDKLLDWLSTQPKPDLVVLPYTLLIALAQPCREALGCPVLCALQGEDLFLEGLPEPWRSRSLALIREQVRHVDLFLAVSEFYQRLMKQYLEIPADKMELVPLGVDFAGFDGKAKPNGPFTIGYFARVAPEKGLHVLAEAFRHVKQQEPEVRMVAAGYLPPEHRGYLETCQGMAPFEYRGALDRAEKIAFLQSVDLLCVPSPYADPKGLYLLEALAVGTPFAQPRHGSFPEIAERTGGGFLLEKAEPGAVAEGLLDLIRHPALVREAGRLGAENVRRFYSVEHAAECAERIYQRVVDAHAAPAGELVRA